MHITFINNSFFKCVELGSFTGRVKTAEIRRNVKDTASKRLFDSAPEIVEQVRRNLIRYNLCCQYDIDGICIHVRSLLTLIPIYNFLFRLN